MAATFVLGQPNFGSRGSGTGLDQFHGPSAITYHEPTNTLWVCDAYNNRTLRFSNIDLFLQSTGVLLNFPFTSPDFIIIPKVQFLIKTCYTKNSS
jgi:hypothetical protein